MIVFPMLEEEETNSSSIVVRGSWRNGDDTFPVRIDKFGGSHEGKVKRHPVTSTTVAHVRIDNERAGPPPSPIQT
jgi:hypothetical protein